MNTSSKNVDKTTEVKDLFGRLVDFRCWMFVVLFFSCRGETSTCKRESVQLLDMNQKSYVFIKHSLLALFLCHPEAFFSLLCFVLAVYSLCNLHCFLSLSLYLPPLPSSLPSLPSSLPLSLWCVLQQHVTWRPHMARACERQRERFQNMQSEHSWLALPPPSLSVQCYRVQSQSLV